MSSETVTTDANRIKEVTLSLLQRVLPEKRPFAVRLWDGTLLPATLPSITGEPATTLVLRDETTLGVMLQLPLDLNMGEAYLRGEVEIEGNIETVFGLLEQASLRLSPLDWIGLAKEAMTLRRRRDSSPSALAAKMSGRKHSRDRDRQAITHHYDLSNRFYKLWLDERMVYSCGYFPDGNETLDEAQAAKLDLICRKLQLKPGERLLDIGCGWGGLVSYAAEHYGVSALGVTLSERQLDLARARVQSAGLADRVELALQDYRDLSGTFDKIVSVGMAEHVGGVNLAVYFQTAWNHLKPDGLMLNHAISQGPIRSMSDKRIMSGEFMRRYVFPDGEIIPVWQSLKEAEAVGFELRDVEDWREHYAKTLRCWVQNLETYWDDAVAEVGLERARLWRLYLSACAHQFAYARLAVHQALLAKPGPNGHVTLPASRAGLYHRV